MEDYANTEFRQIKPLDYAEKLKSEFDANPLLWYSAIMPKEAADRLKEEYNNDYSLVWHVHCNECYKHIDKYTSDSCYVSNDDVIWLCAECHKHLQTKN